MHIYMLSALRSRDTRNICYPHSKGIHSEQVDLGPVADPGGFVGFERTADLFDLLIFLLLPVTLTAGCQNFS